MLKVTNLKGQNEQESVKICGQLVYVDYFCGFESKEGNSLLAANGFNFVLKSVREGVVNGDRPPLWPSLLIRGGKQRARSGDRAPPTLRLVG